MGYTHYFPQKHDFTETEWKSITTFAKKLFKYKKDILANWNGDKGTKPEISETEISFNGIDEDAHETCTIHRFNDKEFNFCKTAEKPYDAVVVALLIYINDVAKSALDISSDGNKADWKAGLDLICHGSNSKKMVILPKNIKS